MISTKTEFIAVLREYARDPNKYTNRQARGELMLINALADYFKTSTDIEDKPPGINWLVDLDAYLVEAFEDFRTAEQYLALRDAYLQETDHEIPDLVDIRGGYGRRSVIYSLINILPALTRADWLKRDLESLNSETHVVILAWRGFIRHCYRRLIKSIRAESHRGRSGRFGRTDLHSFALAGRVMFTFSRVPELQSEDSTSNGLYRVGRQLGRVPERSEQSISFVADESDDCGFRAGLQSVTCDYRTCVSMIDEVVANWDISRFVRADDVGLQ